jgi:hypothetical protein
MKIIWTLILAGGACALWAQNPPDRATQDRILDRLNVVLKAGTVDLVGAKLLAGPTVKGAPYSAEAVTETTQTLADGNRIVQRSSSMLYRDSEGRERREETSSMGAIFISDPVAKVSYTLHPDTQTAEKGPLGALIADKVFYVRTAATAMNPQPNIVWNAAPATASAGRGGRGTVVIAKSANTKEEQLGTMPFDGVPAQGTRTTTTIPAGDIGNERDIQIIDERWYSPDLQITVMTRHSDPRSGETVYKLNNILRNDQIQSLFEVPSNYTVQEPPAFGFGLKLKQP